MPLSHACTTHFFTAFVYFPKNLSSFFPHFLSFATIGVMLKKFIIPLAVVLASCSAPTAQVIDTSDEHSDQGSEMSMSASSVDRLNNSPRHQEWVEVKNGSKTIYTWVVYPEMSDNRPIVILIHENRGLNDWARGMADQVAEAGYIAVAPDLLSGFSEDRTRTSDFLTDDERTKAISALKSGNVQSDLSAVADWAKTIDASNGKLVSAGFCWGGGQSFRFATESDDLALAMVFYGTGREDAADYEAISSPDFG